MSFPSIHHHSLRTLGLSLCIVIYGCAPGPGETFQLASQGLLCGDLSENGQFAVIGSIHHGGSYWNLSTKERLYNWNHKSEDFSSLRNCTLSGNGQYAVTTEESTLVLWNTQTGKSEQFWAAADRILAIALNHDGSKALIGLRNGDVNYFDVRQGSTIHSFHHDAEIRAVALSGDADIGLSAGDDMRARTWDLKRGKMLSETTLRNQIKTATLSRSGKLAFATSQRETMQVWQVQSGEALFSAPTRYDNFSTAIFSTDESRLSTGTFSGEITQWQLPSGSELTHWQASPRKAYGASASKAILAIEDLGDSIVALTADGMFERFEAP